MVVMGDQTNIWYCQAVNTFRNWRQETNILYGCAVQWTCMINVKTDSINKNPLVLSSKDWIITSQGPKIIHLFQLWCYIGIRLYVWAVLPNYTDVWYHLRHHNLFATGWKIHLSSVFCRKSQRMFTKIKEKCDQIIISFVRE